MARLHCRLRGGGGDKTDTLQIVVNGQAIASFNNDPGKGFPCAGSKCLDKKGTYVADTVVTGDHVDYTISWTSSNAEKAKHMYIGAGEAIFIGYPGAAPGGWFWQWGVGFGVWGGLSGIVSSQELFLTRRRLAQGPPRATRRRIPRPRR